MSIIRDIKVDVTFDGTSSFECIIAGVHLVGHFHKESHLMLSFIANLEWVYDNHKDISIIASRENNVLDVLLDNHIIKKIKCKSLNILRNLK